MENSVFRNQALLDWLLLKVGFFPKLELKSDKAGFTWVMDGDDKIAIVNESRARRYRHGIRRRCRHLAQQRYMGGNQVKICPGDVVINVGANIGEVSRYFADCGAKVLAFEPDPVARQCLEVNTTPEKVEILPFGLWKESGPLQFFLNTDQADSSAINPSDKQITIDATTLDAIIEQRNLQTIRLLAGDAEGAEPEVLMGATETLKRIDFVSLDCSHERRGEQNRKASIDILTAAGFDLLKSKSHCHLLAKRKC